VRVEGRLPRRPGEVPARCRRGVSGERLERRGRRLEAGRGAGQDAHVPRAQRVEGRVRRGEPSMTTTKTAASAPARRRRAGWWRGGSPPPGRGRGSPGGREERGHGEGGLGNAPPGAGEPGVLARQGARGEDAPAREEVRVGKAGLGARERPGQQVAAGADERCDLSEVREEDAHDRGERGQDRGDRQRAPTARGMPGRPIMSEVTTKSATSMATRGASPGRARGAGRRRGATRPPSRGRGRGPRARRGSGEPPRGDEPGPPGEGGEREESVAPARVLVEPRERHERPQGRATSVAR